MPSQLKVADYMTVAPYSIGIDHSLVAAALRMRELGVRHLPVLHDGALRGVLTAHDVALLEPRFEGESCAYSVREALHSEPYTVAASAPLSRVARAMAAHKYDCAVVMERGQVKGIFTTSDALGALADVLDDEGAAHEALAPSQVRAIVLAEHVHVRHLLDRTQEFSRRVLTSGSTVERDVRALRDAARGLFTAMSAHMELENQMLAPALAEADAFGKLRAEQLVEGHDAQKRELEVVVMALDDANQAPSALAVRMEQLLARLRADMETEEAVLLSPDLLSDDGIVVDCTTG